MALFDKWAEADSNIVGPGRNFAAITPHNSTDLSFATRGIYVGVAGDVVAVDFENNAVTFKNAAAGSIIPIRARRINSTNTTATNLVAVW